MTKAHGSLGSLRRADSLTAGGYVIPPSSRPTVLSPNRTGEMPARHTGDHSQAGASATAAAVAMFAA